MMSENKKLVPKRRFREFRNSDDWEQCKLSEMTYLITKGTTPIDKSGKGNINFVKIENIDSSSGEISISSKISEEEHNGYLKRSQLQENDILFSIAGTLGRVTLVNKRVLPANTNQALAIIRLKTGYLNYIKTYLKGRAVADFIKKNPTIGAQPNLSLEQVGNLDIDLPSYNEQQEIGTFFTQLDNLITLHQRKLEKMKALKTAYLSEMFPAEGERKPKRRFKGFENAWEQRKLKQLANFTKGQGYSKSDLTDAGTPVILYGRLYTKYQSIISEVDTFVVPKIGSVYSTGKEVIVPASGETAEDIARASAVVKSGILLGGDLNIIYPNKNISTIFLALSISNGQQQKELAKKAQGKSVVHLHNGDLEGVTITYPCKEEQEKIESVFSNIDNLITLHQRNLEKLQNIKNAYLNEMFVGGEQ